MTFVESIHANSSRFCDVRISMDLSSAVAVKNSVGGAQWDAKINFGSRKRQAGNKFDFTLHILAITKFIV